MNLLLKQEVFFVKFPNSFNHKVKKFVEPKKIYSLIQIYSNFYKYKNLYIKIKKKLTNFIIISVKSPISDRFNNFLIKENLHTHLIYLSFTSKIAYALNHPKKCLNLNKFLYIEYSKMPKTLKIKIESYFSKVNILKKIIIYLLSLIIRVYVKLFKN